MLQFYGPGSCGPIGNECGAVFQLAPLAHQGGPWTETLIYEFKGKGGNDGESPNGGLVIDSQGNLYGVTAYGGTGDCVLLGVPAGCGTVYELSPPAEQGGEWTETILYSFPTAKQGYVPNGNLVFDSAGNLYGATVFGGGKGTTCDKFYQYCGAVFELSPPKTKGDKWTQKVLHAFANGTDGATPNGGLVLDTHGAIYGTTSLGGYHQGQCDRGEGFNGCGTVFRLNPPKQKDGNWDETVLHRFKGPPSDGLGPAGGPALGAQGALYGGTVGGGTQEDGVVFELKPPTTKGGKWAESLLHTFTGGNDGQVALAGLLVGPDGNLYGSAGGGTFHRGVIFRMSPSTNRVTWAFHVLYSFTGSPDGYDPLELTFGKGGAIFGATLYGGTGQCQSGCGTVFQAQP